MGASDSEAQNAKCGLITRAARGADRRDYTTERPSQQKESQLEIGTKVVLIVSGQHRCRTRRRFEYAEENSKVRQLPARGLDYVPSSSNVSRTSQALCAIANINVISKTFTLAIWRSALKQVLLRDSVNL